MFPPEVVAFPLKCGAAPAWPPLHRALRFLIYPTNFSVIIFTLKKIKIIFKKKVSKRGVRVLYT